MNNEIEDNAVERKYCVYIHTSPSGKKYVGQTGVGVENRWGKDGCNYLQKRDGKYNQPIFAHAILKYGWDNFQHEIVKDCLTKEDADVLERLLIENLNTTDSKYGYNSRDGGSCGSLSKETKRKISESLSGKSLSEETKRKLSESHKGIKHSDESIMKMREAQVKAQTVRKIAQYNTKGEFVKVWDCISDAGRELGIDVSSIAKCCKGQYLKSGEFIWKYLEDELTKEEVALRNTNKRDKRVAQYSLSGDFICVFNSITEAASKTGIYRSGIYRCCGGWRNQAGGFIWKYYDDVEESLQSA